MITPRSRRPTCVAETPARRPVAARLIAEQPAGVAQLLPDSLTHVTGVGRAEIAGAFARGHLRIVAVSAYASLNSREAPLERRGAWRPKQRMTGRTGRAAPRL